MPISRLYYFLTPIFVLLEYAAGVNIRLQTPWENGLFDAAYYLTCFTAAFIPVGSSAMAAFFALIECSVNILLLLLSVMLPIAGASEKLLNGEAVEFEFGPLQITHFVLVGGMLIWVFHSNENLLRQESR
jgi:hypothetical protein